MVRVRRIVVPVMAALGLVALLTLPAVADTGSLPAITQGNTAVFTIGSNQVTVNGHQYTMDVVPFIDSNNRTQVPVRYLAEVMGATNIGWNANTETVNLNFSNGYAPEVQLTVGSDYYSYGGSTFTMDTAPTIINPGRTMLPARFVAEAEGFIVGWNPTTQQVMITNGGTPTDSGNGNLTPNPNSGNITQSNPPTDGNILGTVNDTNVTAPPGNVTYLN